MPDPAMRVPQFDLKRQYAGLREEIRAALDRVCNNTAFILGEEVEKFEQEFAGYQEVKHCVAVNSGTSALHLALLAAGVGAGDEVITTPNSFIGPTEAILYTGARPVFVDIDPATANLDPRGIEAALTPRTKAILPVHLYGRPAELDPMLELARRKGLTVIEDACQAHGARYRRQRVGGLGLVGAFSFYPTKNLAAYGEAGALVTNDRRVAELARSLRNHGESGKYVHERLGYNYRMEGFQAAVLRVKLKRLPEWTRRRQDLARFYRARLARAPLEIPVDLPNSECVYHQFAVYVDDRDRVRAELASHGVATAIHYPRPIHLQAACAGLGYGPGSLPASERACQRVLCLPLFPEMTDAEAEHVAEVLAGVTDRAPARYS